MIYSINLGIGWASSGVEYAQIYRAKMLRNIKQSAKFIFTDMFPVENIEHMTRNIGFEDDEVIWLYTYFTDREIAPVTYTLDMLEKTFHTTQFNKSRNGKVVKYQFEGRNNFYTAYMTDETGDRVHRVELVSRGFLIRKDYYTDSRLYSEYYAPLDDAAHLYQRRFFNKNGTVAYEEIIDDNNAMYKFPDVMVCSKAELVELMLRKMDLTEKDILLIDRTTGIGQAILSSGTKAKKGIIIHADHYSERNANEENILWNNYYEYSFDMHKHIDFYVTATEVQKKILAEQFMEVYGAKPKIFAIPVGSLKELKVPGENGRRKHSLITASRLATEKHVDWLVRAVKIARETVPDITLDIYGKGGEEDKISDLIKELELEDSVRLMGQHDMTDIYQDYEAYYSGSQSEGFGLTLMEAIGAGLPIIGFDVRYGNRNFIENGRNGYLIGVDDDTDQKDKIRMLAEAAVKLFTEADMDEFHHNSYEKAREYLTEEVGLKWKRLIAQMM